MTIKQIEGPYVAYERGIRVFYQEPIIPNQRFVAQLAKLIAEATGRNARMFIFYASSLDSASKFQKEQEKDIVDIKAGFLKRLFQKIKSFFKRREKSFLTPKDFIKIKRPQIAEMMEHFEVGSAGFSHNHIILVMQNANPRMETVPKTGDCA